MLRNSNFRPVIRNDLHFYHNTTSYSVTRSSTNTHKPNTDSHKFTYKHSSLLATEITNRKKYSYMPNKIKSLIMI